MSVLRSYIESKFKILRDFFEKIVILCIFLWQATLIELLTKLGEKPTEIAKYQISLKSDHKFGL